MIKSLETLHETAKAQGARVLAVAAAQDAEVLLAVEAARQKGIATAILVGDAAQIQAVAQQHQIDLSHYEIIDQPR